MESAGWVGWTASFDAGMTGVRSNRVASPRLWAWYSLAPGIGVSVLIYAGVRARRALWLGLGLLWAAVVVSGLVWSSAASGHSPLPGLLLIFGWVGTVATTFAIRPAWERQMDSVFEIQEELARDRLADRHRARRLVTRNPSLAQEMGIGRPDLQGAHAGLVDVNNASATALQELPGVDAELAAEIVNTREQLGGFSSLQDLGETLDIDGGIVERIRGRAVFLPRP